MDSDIIYKNAKARFDHLRNQQILREKYQAKLKFAYSGGMWAGTPELINILQCMLDEEDIVIEDLYQNPVKVNTKELLNLAKMHWQEQMNGWLDEFEKNSKER